MISNDLVETIEDVRSKKFSNYPVYIGFTGLDGAGKSTQAGRLGQYLRSLKRQCYVCEPKDDLVPQLAIAIGRENDMSPRDYFGAYSFELAKAFSVVRHHYSFVLPFLNRGIDVIEPRTNFCRLGLAVAHDSKNIEKIVEVYKSSKKYDFVFWIDTPPEVAYKRVNERGMDYEPLEDLQKFHDALSNLAQDSCIRINGMGTQDEVFARIRQKLIELIGDLDHG